MEITLRINGKDKTFVQNFVSAYFYRKVLVLQKEEEGKDFTPEMQDKEVDLVCEIFGNQFKRDDFYKGVSGVKGQFKKEIYRILLQEIIGLPSEEEIADFLKLPEKETEKQ